MNHSRTDIKEQGAVCEIRVNEKGVTVVGEQHTGADIKRVAIEQGVSIKEDFVLSIEYEPRKTRIIADEEVVVVETGTCFTVVADDDNS